MAVSDFQSYIDEYLQPWLEVSAALDESVAEIAGVFHEAVQEELKFIENAVTNPKPTDDDFQQSLAPISALMLRVGEVKDGYRGDFINHLSAVSEAVAVLGWVCVEPVPAPYVKDIIPGSQFWSNKILVQHKGDENHTQWVNNLNGFLNSLPGYITKYHTTGIAWNSGGSVSADAGMEQVAPDGFDDLVNTVQQWKTCADAIGDKVAEIAEAFLEAVVEEQNFINGASSMPKPGDEEFQQMLAPISANMMKISEISDSYRGNLSNHLKAVAEATPILGWVCVEPAPAPYAAEMIGASKFWSNKILKDYRGKDENHENFVYQLNEFLEGLVAYIKASHTTGVTWNKPITKSLASASNVEFVGGSSVADFQQLIDEFLVPLMELSNKFGSEVAEITDTFINAVRLEKELVETASNSSKPDDEGFAEAITPISALLMRVGELKSNYRGDFSNHFAALAEAVMALQWICIEPAPGPFVKDTIPGSEFWSNKILQQYKGSNQDHVDWVNNLNGFLKGIVPYIMKHHTTGLSWN
eukprot:TRINITY_DN2754_c0_g1_i1.p1 TRINITY_DN2754_c0_g1~~TRINITY_DN2754_c0_g1_i1.p1  ORF type:complete len:528 (-),score=154.62 TRINITY_DN2754_c0_g1_i1:29-1612(-)